MFVAFLLSCREDMPTWHLCTRCPTRDSMGGTHSAQDSTFSVWRCFALGASWDLNYDVHPPCGTVMTPAPQLKLKPKATINTSPSGQGVGSASMSGTEHPIVFPYWRRMR